jgi:hypothetical protein
MTRRASGLGQKVAPVSSNDSTDSPSMVTTKRGWLDVRRPHSWRKPSATAWRVISPDGTNGLRRKISFFPG